MPHTLRIGIAGLGPVGQAAARIVLQTPGLELVAAADPTPTHAGVDLATLLGLPKRLRLPVQSTLGRSRRPRIDVAVVCTASPAEALAQIRALVTGRTHVLTTCEELAAGGDLSQELRALDRLARARKVAVLAASATGFAMHTLPLLLTGACASVKRVSVTRVIDAGARGLALQRRVGAGLNPAQFRRALSEGTVRHAGLVESARAIASSLGWTLDRVDEALDPAIAPRDLDTDHLRIAAGSVAGVRQSLRAFRRGELAVSLDLQVYVGAEAPRDHVLVDGAPPVDATVAGGISDDLANAALLVNSLPRLLEGRAGLLASDALPIVHCLAPQPKAQRKAKPRGKPKR